MRFAPLVARLYQVTPTRPNRAGRAIGSLKSERSLSQCYAN